MALWLKHCSANLQVVEGAPMVQWLEYSTANLQVVGSNLIHTCVWRMLIQGITTQPYLLGVTSLQARLLK